MIDERTREEIILECAKIVKVCWDYYADVPLDLVVLDDLAIGLDHVLPEKLTTKKWTRFANGYQERTKQEIKLFSARI